MPNILSSSLEEGLNGLEASLPKSTTMLRQHNVGVHGNYEEIARSSNQAVLYPIMQAEKFAHLTVLAAYIRIIPPPLTDSVSYVPLNSEQQLKPPYCLGLKQCTDLCNRVARSDTSAKALLESCVRVKQ